MLRPNCFLLFPLKDDSLLKSGLLALVEVMNQVTVILDHEFYGLSLVAFDSVEELF
jgi:hypothetical protein